MVNAFLLGLEGGEFVGDVGLDAIGTQGVGC